MVTVIEFADCGIDPIEIIGTGKIKQNCLIYDDSGSNNIIIPLHNILRMTEYRD